MSIFRKGIVETEGVQFDALEIKWLGTWVRIPAWKRWMRVKNWERVTFTPLCLLLALSLTGCTIAPHGSRTTRKVYTYQGRQDGLVRVERWTDRSAGGGMLLMMDPTLNNVALYHTNSAMQVGGWFTLGNGSVNVDPQTGAIIGAVGTAAGNIIGAALKTAVKP